MDIKIVVPVAAVHAVMTGCLLLFTFQTRTERAHGVGPDRFWGRHPLLKEFCRDQCPMVLIVFLAGLAVCYWSYGCLPGLETPFPLACVKVPIWHLVWLGFWTGYTMGIVGEASGIFSLPYCMSILQFNSVAVSPTSLLVTFLNPFGALLGYWRARQWNLDLALWLCLGAIVGSPIGPFVRVYLLSEPVAFKALIGIALLGMGIHLWAQITPWYLRKTARQRAFKEKFDRMMEASKAAGNAPSGLPADFRIVTVERSFRQIRITYWDEERRLSVPVMALLGFGIGVVASAFGVGGGFILVPALVTFFELPLYVLVAATIPFVIVLSATSLVSYAFILPSLTGISAPPDWAFGLFVASGAILGAWLASKTQRYIPEKYLKPMLGTITGVVGFLYLLNFFCRLPFQV